MILSICLRLWWGLLGVAILITLAGAPAYSQWKEYPSVAHCAAEGPIPNYELPDKIPAPEGQLTVYADYDARLKDEVPMYVVNRTDRVIEFPSFDGDIYLKLEHQLADGSWERAQAQGSTSCGNSYGIASLRPGQHFVLSGYMPSAGTKARVRFAAYGGFSMVSNGSDGFYLERDVADAQMDSIGSAIPHSIYELVRPQPTWNPTPLPAESRVVALRLLQVTGLQPGYQKAAAKLADDWEKKPKPTAEETAAAQAFREILAEKWPPKRDLGALLKYCLKALSAEKKPAGFGLPENNPSLLWRVISDLASWDKIKDPAAWKPLAAFVIAHPSPENVRGIISVAAVPRLADELFGDDFFAENIYHRDSWVQEVCAKTLARRWRQERLASLGWKMDAPGQILVLKALSSRSEEGVHVVGRPLGPGSTVDEEEFWKYCLKTQPLEAMNALQFNAATDEGPVRENVYGGTVHDAIHDYLVNEAAKGTKAGKDFEMGEEARELRGAIELLGTWNSEGDNALFRKLLKHRGFEKSEVSTDKGKRFIQQNFLIREAARDALAHRAQPLPEKIVTTRKILL